MILVGGLDVDGCLLKMLMMDGFYCVGVGVFGWFERGL